MKSRLYASLSVFLCALLAFGAPVSALAENFPDKLDKWVSFRSIEKGWWANIKKSVVKFAQYNDFFSPTLTNGAKLYVKESEKDGVATLKEANCTLSIDVGRIWDSYYAQCGGERIGLLKPTGITFGKVPKVVVQGPPQVVKNDPVPEGGTGTGTTNPKVGTGDTNPQVGTGDTNPQVGTGDTNPQVGTGDTNPTTVKKTPFDEALEKLATLFTGKKVPPAVIEFLAAKDESSKKAFVEWMGKAETTADSLLKTYEIKKHVVDCLTKKNPAMLEWLTKKGIVDKDLEDMICQDVLDSKKTTSTTSQVVKEAKPQLTALVGENGDPISGITDGNRTSGGEVNTSGGATTTSPFDPDLVARCDKWKSFNENNKPPPGPNSLTDNGTPTPDLTAGENKGPAITPDVEQAKKDDAKKKADLARSALGGAYGAVAFGILGMIFGGPFGLVVGAMVGFGLVGGMTYLNNNKIK